MSQEDFTKGISPAGGRRLEPGPHMESERAPVKSAEGDQHWHAVLRSGRCGEARTPFVFYICRSESVREVALK